MVRCRRATSSCSERLPVICAQKSYATAAIAVNFRGDYWREKPDYEAREGIMERFGGGEVEVATELGPSDVAGMGVVLCMPSAEVDGVASVGA
jgi:hypothetical protein